MTVRVTVLKGESAGRYYLDEGGLGRYYLDDGEPAGQWWGSAAASLALQGALEPDAFLAVMAGLDPATGQRLGRRYGEASVRGYDATFSAPKSVSLLFAFGDPEVRQAVIEAHDQAVAATLGWLQSHAHTRMRVRGHVVTVDAEGLVVATFRQHTSRALDPQLHTHAVIANRVPAGDGRWLALDARTLLIDQRTVSALYHANLRAELTRTLGVEWGQPEHGVAEMAGIPSEVLRHFSQRSGDVERRAADKLRRFERDMSRSPTRRERWRLEREAAVDSRPARSHGHDAAVLHDWWNERLRGLGQDRAGLVSKVIGRQRRLLGVDGPTATRMLEEAVTSLVEHQSTWRPAELVRELAATVPTGVTVEPTRLTGWLDRLAEKVSEARCVDLSRPSPGGVPTRRDGRPINEAAVDRALTTQAILDEEEGIIEWAERRLGDLPAPTTTALLGRHLGAGQQAVAAAVAAGRPLELVIGPAGTGKTTALEPAVTYLQERGRAVFGVTPNAAAAHVLAAETGMAADTLDKLLHEHRCIDRLPDPAYALPPGATVIVDEAGAVSTPKVAQLARLADRNRWRVVLVGDPRQFSSVGRGGMFEHLVASYGANELDQVHRFVNPWERTASLRLRTGDPTVLVEYERRGRLHQGTPADHETEIIAAWRQARQRGETVALMANSNDTVHRLNLLAQRDRLDRGELDPAAPRLDVDDMIVHPGDEVVTRRNDRSLRTDQGLMVKNRDHWTVQTVHTDRSL